MWISGHQKHLHLKIFQGALAKQNRLFVTVVLWRHPALLQFKSNIKPPRSASKWVRVMLWRECSCQVLISWESVQGGQPRERMKWQRLCGGGVRQAEEGPCGAGGIWAVLTNWQCCCTSDIATACLPVRWSGPAQAALPAGQAFAAAEMCSWYCLK